MIIGSHMRATQKLSICLMQGISCFFITSWNKEVDVEYMYAWRAHTVVEVVVHLVYLSLLYAYVEFKAYENIYCFRRRLDLSFDTFFMAAVTDIHSFT